MVAITVDHKVRRESTEEAENVGKLLKERGVDHRLVACEWPRGLPIAAPQVPKEGREKKKKTKTCYR
jgi:hypothetical protein